MHRQNVQDDISISTAAATFFAGARAPHPMIMGFIDEQLAQGYAVELEEERNDGSFEP